MLGIALWLAFAPIQTVPTASVERLPRAEQTRGRAQQTSGDAIVAVFNQAYSNWILSCETPGFGGHRIQFDLTLDTGGRIVGGPTLVHPRNDPGWRGAAESARLALLRSAPFDVPPDFTGGEYRPTFNTSRACARASRADED